MDEELSWAQIGDRIRVGRAAVGMSQQALADSIGLERSMVSKLEKGGRRVDAVELTRIARVLDWPLSYFLNPVPQVVSRRADVSYGVDAGDSAAARNVHRTEALLSDWLRDVRLLVDSGFLHIRRPLCFRDMVTDSHGARSAARWLRRELALGNGPVDSVADVSERAGQFLASMPLPSDGASLVDGDIAVAVVSAEQAPGRRRSTGAHELGHMVLGDEFSSDLGVHASREERERSVEAFAAEFLLPQDGVRSVADVAGEEARREALVRVSATYRVSWTLAVSQLKGAGAVSVEETRRLRACTPTDVEFRDALGWRPQPDLTSVRVPPRYASAVIAALRAAVITPQRAVEMMRGQVSVQELTEEAAD